MNHDKPDFAAFSLEELYEAREGIDGEKYPDRLREIELLIRALEGAKRGSARQHRFKLDDDNGQIASMKPGRAQSLGRGLSEIAGAVLFAWILVRISSDVDAPVEVMYAVAAFTLVTGVVAGLYHIYNAFAANRFSDQDVVASGAEPDPFSKALGYEKNKHDP